MIVYQYCNCIILFHRIIQICVYAALIAVGYIIYRYGNKQLEQFSQWLLRENHHKDWVAVPSAILLFGYLFLFYYVSDEIKVVYAENNTHTYHLTKQCDDIHHKITPTFQFQAKIDGYSLCSDCEIVRNIERDE